VKNWSVGKVLGMAGFLSSLCMVSGFNGCSRALLSPAPIGARRTLDRHASHRPSGLAAEFFNTNATATSPQVAPFLGNLSSIVAPVVDGVELIRGTGCALTLRTFSYIVNPSQVSSTTISDTPSYEKTIHNNAFLTTTPDQFPAGCVDSTEGITSGPFVNMGTGKNGNVLGASFGEGSAVLTAGMKPDGTVTTPVSNTTAQPPFSIVSGDLNKDGNQDIVSINTDGLTGSATVFLGNADGSYQPGATIALPTEEVDFAVLDDIDGDGNLDLIVNTGNNALSVFLGKGDGTFKPIQTVAPAGASIFFTDTFISADVNGDHKKDIVTSEGQVFLGAGDGLTFTLVPTPAFPRIVTASNEYAPGIVAADFNKDGKMDLVTDDGQTIRAYRGAGDGTFTAGPAYSTIGNRGLIVATDIDGDGNLDLVSGFGSHGLYGGDDFLPNITYALMGNGDGTFQGAPELPIKYTGTNLLDLNNDGRPDMVGLITGPTQNTLTTFLTGSNGIPNGVGVDSYALGAFNTNSSTIPGLLYLTASPQVQTFNLALGVGDGSFQAPTAFPVPTLVPTGNDINESLTGLRTGDFNHDGKLDIAYSFSDQASDTQIFYEGFAVQLGNGDGTFQAPKITLTFQSATAPQVFPSNMLSGIADVNNDNFPDVFMIVPNGISNGELGEQVQLFVGNGDGTFKAPNTLALTPNIRPSTPDGLFGSPFAFADLNGDGNVDLVASGSSADGTTPQLAIALGNGDGTFKPPTILVFQGFGFPSGPALANFTGGGKLDLYVDGAGEGGGLGIFPGNGDGTFQTISNGDGTVSPPQQIVLSVGGGAVSVDLNKDGVPDLIAGNVVLLNESGAIQPGPAATTTAVTSSLNPSTSGTSVTFTGMVTSTTAGTITGSVTFFDGATSLGTGTLAAGAATLTTSLLTSGSHSITAQYGGDTNFATSTSPVLTQTVNAGTKASTATMAASSLNPSTTGTAVTFTATVSSTTAGTITGMVTFLDGATSLGTGTLAGGVATFATSTLAAGSHSITAQYGGDVNYAGSTSAVVTQTVNAGGDFSVSASPTALAIVAGQSGTVALTVTPQNGSTQTVTFSCGNLPGASACAFVPTSITLDGTHPAMTQVTISTTARKSAAMPAGAARPPAPGNLLRITSVCLAGIFGLLLVRRRDTSRRVVLAMLVLTIPVALLVSCSNAPRPSGGGGTPAGMSQVTITAAAGSDMHPATVSLIVQ
jgi:Bacterial Ig-like domain (group 3)/FG-GAP-like repeat